MFPDYHFHIASMLFTGDNLCLLHLLVGRSANFETKVKRIEADLKILNLQVSFKFFAYSVIGAEDFCVTSI